MLLLSTILIPELILPMEQIMSNEYPWALSMHQIESCNCSHGCGCGDGFNGIGIEIWCL